MPEKPDISLSVVTAMAQLITDDLIAQMEKPLFFSGYTPRPPVLGPPSPYLHMDAFDIERDEDGHLTWIGGGWEGEMQTLTRADCDEIIDFLLAWRPSDG